MAKHIADAMFDLLSLYPVMLTYTEFIEAAVKNPQLCLTMHKVMLLQGKEHGTNAHKDAIEELLEITKDWFEWQKSGRLVGVDLLVEEFRNGTFEDEDRILEEMADIRAARSGVEKERCMLVGRILTLTLTLSI